MNIAAFDACIGRGVAAIRAREYQPFINYFVRYKRQDIYDLGTGATFPNISSDALASLKLSLPPLPEQRRIVGILDEAFAGIATAKANAERNLRNTRTLFSSYISDLLEQRSADWPKRRLGDIVTRLTNGFVGPTRNIYHDSGVPYLLARHVKDNRLAFDGRTYVSEVFNRKLKKSLLKTGDVLLVQSGHIGHSAVVPAEHEGHNCHAMIVISPVGGILTGEYLSLLFNSVMRREFDAIKTGSTVPHLNCGSVIEMGIALPDVATQIDVVAKSKALADDMARLGSLYQQKLAALDALKKSLLHQAFSGRLTRDEPAVIVEVKPLTPFPVEIPGISTTDLHAGILAMSFQLHEARGNTHVFGHVKAEKIADAIERCVGIALGRKPVKDRFGPNDFTHLMKVEHRARKTNAFDFQRVENNAYRVEKLRGFDRLVGKARAVLGDRLAEVEALLDLMLPWDTTTAEVFATVYAGWNNLLIDGKTPTNEEIVYESRENWHPEKLKIARDRFFKAIQFIRDRGMVPQGRGSKVEAKGK